MDALVVRLLLLLTLLLSATPASAAWSFVGGAVASSGQTITKSVTAGNLIIVGYMGNAQGSTLSISDTVNTWTTIGSPLRDTTNNNELEWWWASAATTASITATVTDSLGTTENIWLGEWHSDAGNVPANALEAATQNGSFANGSGSVAADGDTSNAATPTSNGDLIVGWINDTQNTELTTHTEYTAGTSFTKRAGASNDPVAVNGQTTWAVEDRTQTTAANAAATWTAATTDAYSAFVGFFKESGTAPAVTTPERTKMGVGT